MISGADPAGGALIVAYHGVSVVSAVICLGKGKLTTGVVGFLLWPVGLVGAIRLAEPDSFWARRFYEPDKLQRSRERYRDRRGAEPRTRTGRRARGAAPPALAGLLPLLAQESLELGRQLVAARHAPGRGASPRPAASSSCSTSCRRRGSASTARGHLALEGGRGLLQLADVHGHAAACRAPAPGPGCPWRW